MFIAFDLIIDDHDEAGQHVGSNDTTEADQSLLADGNPWGVADSQEYGLIRVNDWIITKIE
jgi:hypothetical protein